MTSRLLQYISISVLFAVFISCNNPAEKPADTPKARYGTLHQQADSIAKTVPCKLAFALVNIETSDTFSYNGGMQMPMQSTVKFPLALMVLQQIDSGKLTLDQKIHVTKEDLVPDTYSPMRDSLHGQPGDMTLHDMLVFMICQSDNIACHVFTRMMGGPAKLEAFTKAQGMQGIGITSVEGVPAINFNSPHSNWCLPVDMANLLVKFYKGNVVSKVSTDTLRNIMERTTGGAGRIKGLLPAGTVVAHKTGTSGIDNGITAAVNDIGIITLPNGNHLVLAVYVSDITGEQPVGEGIIAKTAKAVYDAAVAQ